MLSRVNLTAALVKRNALGAVSLGPRWFSWNFAVAAARADRPSRSLHTRSEGVGAAAIGRSKAGGGRLKEIGCFPGEREQALFGHSMGLDGAIDENMPDTFTA